MRAIHALDRPHYSTDTTGHLPERLQPLRYALSSERATKNTDFSKQNQAFTSFPTANSLTRMKYLT